MNNNNFDWQSFLKKESTKVISDYENGENYWEFVGQFYELPEEAFESQWLGFPGASEKQITAAEDRLGTVLPPSYRNFLKVTNGWLGYPAMLRLRSIEEIEWFCTQNQNWIDIWIDSLTSPPSLAVSDEQYFVYGRNVEQPLRVEYLQTALQISDREDGAVILLNPKIIQGHEWEAWLFSNHILGAKRYRSFLEMLQISGMSGIA